MKLMVDIIKDGVSGESVAVRKESAVGGIVWSIDAAKAWGYLQELRAAHPGDKELIGLEALMETACSIVLDTII